MQGCGIIPRLYLEVYIKSKLQSILLKLNSFEFTKVGLSDDILVPNPNYPNSFDPQENTLLSVVKARQCNDPQLNLIIFYLGKKFSFMSSNFLF